MAKRAKTEVVQVNLRLREELRLRLQREAEKAGRSFNQEMVHRLVESFRRDSAEARWEKADKVLDIATKQLDEALRISDEATSIIAEIERDLRAGLTVDDIFPANALLWPNARLRRKKT